MPRHSPAAGPWRARQERVRSCRCLAPRTERSQTLDPDCKSNRRDGSDAAEPREQAVIAASRRQLAGNPAGRIEQLEHEAGVIIDAAAECGGKANTVNVYAAGRKTPGAAFE